MEIVSNILKQILPTLGFMVIAIGFYYIKLLVDRQRYAKQSENHVLIFTLPKAGKFRQTLVPVEVKGGISLVRIPNSKGEITSYSPTHILGEAGGFSVDYPLNKVKFVQTTVTGLIYYEGDSEPLSNVSGRPIISAQLITNLTDGVSTASAEAMRKSMEDSAGEKLKKSKGLAFLYFLLIVSIATGVMTLMAAKESSASIQELLILMKQSLGL